MRIVLDTNIVVSALFWEGAPHRLWRAGDRDDLQFITSQPLLLELAATLSKPKFDRKIAGSMRNVDQLVGLYSRFATVVRPIPVPRIAPDPDDDVIIGTALAAQATLIVTGDKPLLSVRTYEGGQIITAPEALVLLGIAASNA